MYVNATDLDDPATPNGQLFYQIVIQLPQINDVMYFQIDSKTGAISLTPEGKSRQALTNLSQRKVCHLWAHVFSPSPPQLLQDPRNWIQ
jgi:hypothetical protein